MMQIEQQELDTQPISEPQVSRRWSQFRARYVKALSNIGVRAQPRALLDVGEEEFVQMQRQIIGAVERILLGEAETVPAATRCARCGMSVEPPTLEEQVAEFEDWQRRHGTVWIWPRARCRSCGSAWSKVIGWSRVSLTQSGFARLTGR